MPNSVEIKSVKHIIDTDDRLNIPSYQRKYSWEESQIDNLWDDIITDVDDKHLMGMLVTCQSSIPNQIDVIDGQQRITTLTALIALLRDIVSDYSVEQGSQHYSKYINVLGKLNDLIIEDTDDLESVRLVTENESIYESEFLSIISLPLDVIDEATYPYVSAKSSQIGQKSIVALKQEITEDNSVFNQVNAKAKAIKKNYLLLAKKVRPYLGLYENPELSEEQKGHLYEKVSRLYKRISTGLEFVHYQVDNEYEAFKLFETMNDRGMTIRPLDLMKNLALKLAGQDKRKQNSIIELWKKIFEENLGSHHSTFIRYFFGLHERHIQKSEVYKQYRDVIFNDSAKVLIRLKHLDQFSIYFSRCLSGDFGSLDSPYNKALYRLHSTKTMQWYSIGMAVFHIKEGSGSAITDSLTRILKATYRLVLTQVVKGIGSNKFETYFPVQAKAILDSVKDPNTQLDELNVVIEDLEEKLAEIGELSEAEIQKAILRKNDVARSLCYLMYLDSVGDSVEPKLGLTLEHVIPQTCEYDDWKDLHHELGGNPPYSDTKTIEINRKKELLCYNIGNMILLSSRLNSSVSNLGFDKKKPKYHEATVIDPISVVPQSDDLSLENIDSWTGDLVRSRSQKISEYLIQEIYN